MASAAPDLHPDPAVQAHFDKLKGEAEALIAAGAHRARGPQSEPDRSVWRILSCQVGDESFTDEQIHAALPAYSVEDISAARARVAPVVERHDPSRPPPATLAEALAAPSISRAEERALQRASGCATSS